MTLRSTKTRVRRRRFGALLACATLALAVFAGTSAASLSDYSSPLYLSGGPSANVTGSYQLLPSAGPAAPPTPTLSVTAGGTSSYGYYYAYKSAAGAYTISALAQATNPTAVQLTNVPLNKDVEIYRGLINPADGTAVTFNRLVAITNNMSATYNDPLADISANPALPEAGNRMGDGTSGVATGYLDFSPGIEPATGTSANLTPPTVSATAPTTFNGKGWVVDGTGPLTFQAGTWTFSIRTRLAASAIQGTAHLVVGLWKVTADGSGGIASATAVLDPSTAAAEGSANMNGATTTPYTFTASLPQFALAANERLYVQFWRRQTVGTTAGASSRFAQILAYQGTNPSNIAHPAADDAAPNAFSITGPAAGATIRNGQALTSNATDPSPGSGIKRVDYYYCPGFSCTPLTGTNIGSSSTGAAYSLAWNSQPADSTYTLVAVATDNVGFTTTSTSTVTVTVDNTAPDTTIDSAPSTFTNSTSASFGFSSPDGTATFKCSLDGGAYSACTTPASYSGLTAAAHTFDVEAIDPVGNVDPTPAHASWTVDTTPPVTTIDSKPSNPSNTAGPSFAFSANESVTGFKCSLDGAAYTSCTSPKTLPSLSDGSHTFGVEATADQAGNPGSPATYTWTVDTTPPDTTITASPTSPTNATGASFSFTSPDATASFKCSLDGAAYTSCTSPSSATSLPDGTHTYDVEAVDPVGNVDPTPAHASWTIDTTPPNTSFSTTPPAVTTSAAASFAFSANEPGSTFECALDGAAFATCTSPAAYASLADGMHTLQVRAIDTSANADPTPASFSWRIDTTAPSAPALVAPTDLALSRTFTQLVARFADPDATDTGTISFRACADALCVAVASAGTSATVANGAQASWTLPPRLADGLYFWQARATDAAGNTSAWSPTWTFVLDTVAPSPPVGFRGEIVGGRLTLGWSAPAGDTIGSYVVLVNGAPWRTVDGATLSVDVGPFDGNDGRRFAVVAIDRVGNAGTPAPTLVGVPSLVGLTLTQAAQALSGRGLALKNQKLGFSADAATIVAQTPSPSSLAPKGSTVQVLLAQPPAAETPLAVRATPARVSCLDGGGVRVRLELSRRANVTWRLRDARGRSVASGAAGGLPAGSTQLTIRVPKRVRVGGTYRLALVATAQGHSVTSTVVVAASRRATNARCG